MRCSNRKLLIIFEGSAQRERTIIVQNIINQSTTRDFMVDHLPWVYGARYWRSEPV